MTASITPPLFGVPVASPPKEKRVLLVNTSSAKRDIRSEVMRKLGMDVNSAADITEARFDLAAPAYESKTSKRSVAAGVEGLLREEMQ